MSDYSLPTRRNCHIIKPKNSEIAIVSDLPMVSDTTLSIEKTLTNTISSVPPTNTPYNNRREKPLASLLFVYYLFLLGRRYSFENASGDQ